MTDAAVRFLVVWAVLAVFGLWGLLFVGVGAFFGLGSVDSIGVCLAFTVSALVARRIYLLMKGLL